MTKPAINVGLRVVPYDLICLDEEERRWWKAIWVTGQHRIRKRGDTTGMAREGKKSNYHIGAQKARASPACVVSKC